MIRRALIILFLICASLLTLAQTAAPVNQSTQIPQASGQPPQPALGPDIPYTELLTPPMPVSGTRAPLRLSSETPRSNYVTGSVGLSTAYDDNMFSSSSHRVGDVSYLFFPTLEVVQSRGHFIWDLGYSPGFTINQRLSERNQSAHDFHVLFGYRLSQHVNLQLHDSFNKTTNLFSGLLGSGSDQPGPLQQPNLSLITPLTNRIANTSGMDLTYQFGPTSMVGASGGYYFVNYGTIQGTASQTYGLIDSRSWNADGFYAHRFAGRHWLGASYEFQRLMFDAGLRTDVQRTIVFYSIVVGSHTSFSVWAGPERANSLVALSSTSGTAFSSAAHWNGAGGVAWTWQGSRTGFTLGYTRQTSDGGGLMEAVRMQTATGSVRRRLTQRWTGNLEALYGLNDPLGQTAVTYRIRTLSGNAGFDYQMNDHLAFGMRYGRDQQKYQDVEPPISANRNRAWFSISYSFSRPLGR